MRLAEARKILEESDKHSRGVVEKAKETIQASLKGKIEDRKMDKTRKVGVQMAYGGTVDGKRHMYAASKGAVILNPGLLALRKKSPEAFSKITKGKSVKMGD